MDTLIQAVVLGLCLEGVFFALFPRLARKSMLQAASLDDQGLRSLGGMALALAVFLLFLLRLWR